MDPDACFSMLLENFVRGEWEDAAENAESLQVWLRRGGFPPGGGRIRKTSIDALLNWLIKHPNRRCGGRSRHPSGFAPRPPRHRTSHPAR